MTVDLVPPALPYPSVQAILLELVDCVCTSLADNGAGPTCWCGLYPGETISWEYCGGECDEGACGMGWVRATTVFPYETFPVPVIDSRCQRPLAWGVEVGALRCMSMGQEIASPEEMADTSLSQVLDARALWLALKCCQDNNGRSIEISPDVYTPVGPLGGCVGGFWTAFLTLDSV